MTIRRRRQLPAAERPAVQLLGAAVFALALALLYVAFAAPRGIPGQQHYNVKLQARHLESLGTQGADVRIAGKRVGQTQNARLENGVATIDLQLDAATPSLPGDTTARIRPRGLLGAEYVDLIPGRSRTTIPDGGTIDAGRTTAAVQLTDVLDGLDRPTRDGLGAAIRGLGGGLAGRGAALNEALALTPRLLRDVSAVTRPLVRSDGAVGGLVRGGDAFFGALDPVRQAIRDGFRAGNRALEPFAIAAGSLERSLRLSPETLETARRSLATTDPFLAHATRLARAATRFTAVAPAALKSTTRFLRDARAPLGDVPELLGRLTSGVPATLALTSSVAPLLPLLDRVVSLTRGPSRILGRYGCDIKMLGANWRSFIGHYPQGQTGELGTLNILRAEVAAPGLTTPAKPAVRLPETGVNLEREPCLPTDRP